MFSAALRLSSTSKCSRLIGDLYKQLLTLFESTYRAADSFPSRGAGYRSPSPFGEKSEPRGNLNGCLSRTVGEPGMVVWLIPQ